MVEILNFTIQSVDLIIYMAIRAKLITIVVFYFVPKLSHLDQCVMQRREARLLTMKSSLGTVGYKLIPIQL